MIVLDTNVLSETLRPRPAREVRDWMNAQASVDLFTTSITEAEILFGVAILPDGRRRTALQAAVERIFADVFGDRILSFDRAAAKAFAEIAANRRRSGRPMPQPDGQIAAIARSHGAAVATRNVGDFAGCGVTLINPWAA
jgi:predicted nucleic acid-binding protein